MNRERLDADVLGDPGDGGRIPVLGIPARSHLQRHGNVDRFAHRRDEGTHLPRGDHDVDGVVEGHQAEAVVPLEEAQGYYLRLLELLADEYKFSLDTPWKKLSKRYGLSLGMLERINHRSRRSKLYPGDKVVVYVPADATPPGQAPTPSGDPAGGAPRAPLTVR